MVQRKSAKSGKKSGLRKSSPKRSSNKRSSNKRRSPKVTRKATMSFDNASDQALWERFLAAQRRLEELAKVDLSKLLQSGSVEPVEVRRSVFVVSAPPPLKNSIKKKRKTSKK